MWMLQSKDVIPVLSRLSQVFIVSAVLLGIILNCRASYLHQSKNENQSVMGRHADELFTAVVQAAVQNSLKHRRWQLCIALDRPNSLLPWKSTGRSCCLSSRDSHHKKGCFALREKQHSWFSQPKHHLASIEAVWCTAQALHRKQS